MNKVTLPAMSLEQAEIIRKIAQKHKAAVTYVIDGSKKPLRIKVEIEK